MNVNTIDDIIVTAITHLTSIMASDMVMVVAMDAVMDTEVDTEVDTEADIEVDIEVDIDMDKDFKNIENLFLNFKQFYVLINFKFRNVSFSISLVRIKIVSPKKLFNL